ncbi:MAG: helix-turn-helix domain-containing protein [Oscillospiraceae bacterium]|nr:helix-turn-helix domain-containing protein [Oscillospiraceae bacterium]
MKTFHEILKDLRIEKNISQKQLSSNIGISTSHYQSYEYGKTKPTIDNLIKFCLYFNVSADYLLGLSDVRERR